MKIFLGTPITGIIDETSVSHISNHNYKALTRIMSDLRGLGHDIFCALEDEKYGAQIADSDSCPLRDPQ